MHTLLFSKGGSVRAFPAIFRPLYFLERRRKKVLRPFDPSTERNGTLSDEVGVGAWVVEGLCVASLAQPSQEKGRFSLFSPFPILPKIINLFLNKLFLSLT